MYAIVDGVLQHRGGDCTDCAGGDPHRVVSAVEATTESINRVVNDLHSRMGPILTRTQMLLDDTQPKISSLVDDASHIVYLARGHAQKMDRILTDATDRLRGQLVHADRILTGTLEAVEDAGVKLKRNFWGPVQKASAMVQGIKVGLDVLRSRRGSATKRANVSRKTNCLFRGQKFQEIGNEMA